MTRASQAGREMRSRLGIEGAVDPEAVAADVGVALIDWPFKSEVEELKLPDTIFIAERLGPKDRRWAVAHALGHHVLHDGNHLWLRSSTQLASKYEREAEAFAYGLLVDQVDALGKGLETTEELSEYFGVPSEMIWVHALMG